MLKKMVAYVLVTSLLIAGIYTNAQEEISEPIDKEIQAMQITEDSNNNIMQKDTSSASLLDDESNYEYDMSSFIDENKMLTDEALFGVWDSVNNIWSTQGKINYDFPGMKEVGESAKSGNYEEAKRAWRDYTRNRVIERGFPIGTTPTQKNILISESIAKNIRFVPLDGFDILGFMDIGGENKYNSCDVTEVLKKVPTQTTKYVTFYGMKTKKDGFDAKFYSKEGLNKPYVDVMINGGMKRFYASDDTYMTAPPNDKLNYGSNTYLLARESYIWQERAFGEYVVPGKAMPMVDGNTKRIALKFDFSEINPGDSVESASLNLYGNDESNEQKEIAWFVVANVAWSEATLNWTSGNNGFSHSVFSSDGNKGMIYSYKPSYTGYRWIEDNTRFAGTGTGTIPSVYRSTGNEYYAYHAIRLHLHFFNDVGDVRILPTDNDNEATINRSLNAAERGKSVSGYIYQLVNSKYMTPTAFGVYMKHMWFNNNQLFHHWTKRSLINWGMSESTGLYITAVYFPEFSESDAWKATALNRMEINTETAIRPSDGMGAEAAISYVDYILSSLYNVRYALNNINEPTGFTDIIKERTRALARYIMFISAPGYRDNGDGDSKSFYDGSYAPRFYTAIQIIGGDEYLEFAESGGIRGKQPDFTSMIYHLGGRVALRDNWTEQSPYIYMNWDGGLYAHGHYDDNHISLAAYGDYLLSDPLMSSYLNDANAIWLRSTDAHNTVTVHRKSQKTLSAPVNDTTLKPIYTAGQEPGRAKLEAWKTYDGKNSNQFGAYKTYNYLKATVYTNEDANHTRSVLYIKPDIFIVTDYLVPIASKMTDTITYHQNWRSEPLADVTMDDASKIFKSNYFNQANIMVVPFDSDKYSSSALKQGLYATGGGGVAETLYAQYEQKAEGIVAYNTLLYPVKPQKDAQITTSKIPLSGLEDKDGSAFSFTIMDNGKIGGSDCLYFNLNDDSKKAEYDVGSYKTNGTLGFVKRNEQTGYENIVLHDATHISNGDAKLVYATENIPEISLKWESNSLRIDIREEYDLNKLTVYNNGGVDTVYVNNESTTFKKTKNYIYFGEKSLIEDEEFTPSLPKYEDKGSNFSGHGGNGGGTAGSSGIHLPDNKPIEVSPNDKLFEEIKGHWAEDEIKKLTEIGVVSGDGSGSYNLTQDVTRGEFSKLLIKALELPENKYSDIFRDVAGTDWYANYIQTAYDLEIIKGYGDVFEPNQVITREQMAQMIYRAYVYKTSQKPETTDALAFDDASEINTWAIDEVKGVIAFGLMQGVSEKIFSPLSLSKREQAFVVIYRLMNKLGIL